MMIQKRQQEASELLCALEELAVEAGMKMRIIDSLRERKEELQSVVTDEQWNKELLRIDETMTYIEKQLSGGENGTVVNDTDMVSKGEIEKRIQAIWSDCRETNRQLQNSYRQIQAVSRQNLENNMMDWTNAAANYEMMSNPAGFSAKCHETGQIYKQQLDQLASEYVDESLGEYERAMNRIKGMLTSTDRSQSSVTVRDIYEKWDSRQESMRRGLIESTERLEKGESDIAEFGQKHMEAMEHIVRRQEKKRTLYIWLPFIIAIALLLVWKGGALIKRRMEPPSEQTVQGEDNFVGQVMNGIKDKTAEKISESVAGNLFYVIKSVLPLVILAATAWILWIRRTQKLYRQWLIRNLSGYMSEQIKLFWKENHILKREEECFRKMEELVEQCCDNAFAGLFGEDFGTEKEDCAKLRIRELKSKWNEIKYV